jgi:hypothetical protein
MRAVYSRLIAKYSSFVRSADMQTDLSVDVTDERSTPSCETFGPVPSSGRKTGRADGAALRPQQALRAAAWNRVATSGEVRRSNATQTLASSRYVIQAPAAAATAVGDGRRNCRQRRPRPAQRERRALSAAGKTCDRDVPVLSARHIILPVILVRGNKLSDNPGPRYVAQGQLRP